MFLGLALETLGARESGTARLDEAIAAFSLALEERTPERTPYGTTERSAVSTKPWN